MQTAQRRWCAAGAAAALLLPVGPATAWTDAVGFGMWLNYEYNNDTDTSGHDDTYGDANFESFNIYADHTHNDWFFTGEVRFGAGSFQGTGIPDAANQAADRNVVGIKQLAIGRHLDEAWTVELGKTAVPFTWSRINFWPGERLTSGFGDQRNLGVKLSGDPEGPVDMSFMFIKNQNFGTDTTSLDDGSLSHWGTNNTYRKLNTLVADFGYTIGATRFGVSVQGGQLANQSGSDELDDAGEAEGALGDAEETESHWAVGVYTEGRYGPVDLKAQAVHYDQDQFDEGVLDPDGFQEGLTKGEGQVVGVSAGYDATPWYTYFDWTMRFQDSELAGATNDQRFFGEDRTMDLVLGSRYDYGPGWFYAELLLTNLTQEDDPAGGFYAREGKRNEVLFLTADYYF